jgi:hypothetical protein
VSIPKLGSGERFKQLKEKIAKNKNVKDPGAVAARIGMNKFGKARFEKMAKAGKNRHS